MWATPIIILGLYILNVIIVGVSNSISITIEVIVMNFRTWLSLATLHLNTNTIIVDIIVQDITGGVSRQDIVRYPHVIILNHKANQRKAISIDGDTC